MAANFSLIFIIAIIIFILYSIVLCSNNLSRGFGDNIDWKTLDDGLQESKRSGKPLMIIIHKTWCGACKALKPKLAASKHIEDLSRNFVMVNAQDSEEPTDKKFSPDGSYIPRILFLDSAGEVKEDLYNENGNSNYKYFYSDPGQVIEVMKKAIKEIPTKIINDVSDEIYQSSRKNDEL